MSLWNIPSKLLKEELFDRGYSVGVSDLKPGVIIDEAWEEKNKRESVQWRADNNELTMGDLAYLDQLREVANE